MTIADNVNFVLLTRYDIFFCAFHNVHAANLGTHAFKWGHYCTY